MSDEQKWKPQIQELQKLPLWMRCESVSNMLTHIGYKIQGMNTPALPKGSWFPHPGHQENNNFCRANINVGPGNSEWFGVPNDYWGALQVS